jgi:crossover junction endodeoxyribonuclease RuvC
MIILGLDPGIARTGYGVVDTSKKDVFMQCGCITTSSIYPLEERLLIIANDLEEIITTFRPDVAVVEEVFFGNNKKTAMKTAQTRGVLLYKLASHHISVQTLTPLQIKSRLTGYGSASKQQMQRAVTQQLHLSAIPKPDDAADALAAALCATL